MSTTKSLQELIIAVHFEVPIPLAVVDLADWIALFSKDFPVVQQLPNLPQVSLPVPGMLPQMQFQMLEVPPLPRMLLRSPDSRYSVQLQNDRFAFGWHRTEPVGVPAAYDGFESHKVAWNEVLDRFEHWCMSRFHQKPKYRLLELSYSNAAPLVVDGRTKRISEIFTFVQAKSRSLGAFNVSWVEGVQPLVPGEPVKGIVSIQVAVGTAPRRNLY